MIIVVVVIIIIFIVVIIITVIIVIAVIIIIISIIVTITEAQVKLCMLISPAIGTDLGDEYSKENLSLPLLNSFWSNTGFTLYISSLIIFFCSFVFFRKRSEPYFFTSQTQSILDETEEWLKEQSLRSEIPHNSENINSNTRITNENGLRGSLSDETSDTERVSNYKDIDTDIDQYNGTSV